MRTTIGDDWKFTISVAGNYNNIPRNGTELTISDQGTYIFNPTQTVGVNNVLQRQTVTLDVHVNAIETDGGFGVGVEDHGEVSRSLSFECDGSEYSAVLEADVKESSWIQDEAHLEFHLKIFTKMFNP